MSWKDERIRTLEVLLDDLRKERDGVQRLLNEVTHGHGEHCPCVSCQEWAKRIEKLKTDHANERDAWRRDRRGLWDEITMLKAQRDGREMLKTVVVAVDGEFYDAGRIRVLRDELNHAQSRQSELTAERVAYRKVLDTIEVEAAIVLEENE